MHSQLSGFSSWVNFLAIPVKFRIMGAQRDD
jgi:hypothetical protein